MTDSVEAQVKANAHAEGRLVREFLLSLARPLFPHLRELVLISLFVGPQPMDLVFNPFEIVALGLAVISVSLVSLDGESNWFEGLQLVAVYLVLAIAFFFVPG